jgi:hypothetical protein
MSMLIQLKSSVKTGGKQQHRRPVDSSQDGAPVVDARRFYGVQFFGRVGIEKIKPTGDGNEQREDGGRRRHHLKNSNDEIRSLETMTK